VWATEEDSGGQVSPRIRDRDLESSVKKCNGNRDIAIRDFPITTRVWAIGTRVKDRWKIVVGNWRIEEDGSRNTIGVDFPITESPDTTGIMVTWTRRPRRECHRRSGVRDP
jgi:hypothetical protein